MMERNLIFVQNPQLRHITFARPVWKLSHLTILSMMENAGAVLAKVFLFNVFYLNKLFILSNHWLSVVYHVVEQSGLK